MATVENDPYERARRELAQGMPPLPSLKDRQERVIELMRRRARALAAEKVFFRRWEAGDEVEAGPDRDLGGLPPRTRIDQRHHG